MLNRIIILTLLAGVTAYGARTGETRKAAPAQPAPPPKAAPAAAKESAEKPQPKPAGAESPNLIPLPSDPHLRVEVTFTGTYRTLLGSESKKLSLRAELTEVTVRRNPSGATEEQTDTFAYVQVPEDKGWGLFCPTNDRFSVTVLAEDDRSRLGVALVRAERGKEPAEVIGRIKADGQGRAVKGMLPIDPSAPTYTIVLFSKESEPLIRLHAQVPRSLRLEFLDVRCGFQPRRPQPDPECPTCAGREVPKEEQGDPKSLEGRMLLSAPTHLPACITKSYENLTDQPMTVQPPLSLRAEESLRSSVAAWQERMGERLWGEYHGKIFDTYYLSPQWGPAAVQADERGLPALTAAPRTQGCAHWDVELTGEVRVILAVPAERVRTIPDWDIRLRRLIQESTAKQPLTSASLALLLNERLSKSAPSEAQGLQGGDVLAVGDVWILRTRLQKSEVHAKPLPRLIPATPGAE